MAAVDENAIASTFLQELGAPDTPEMRKAVIAWLRKESGRSIIGNNPFNISLSAAKNLGIPLCGERTHSVTGQKFAVFCNVADGTKAAARLLLRSGPNDWRHYWRVVNAARDGNPTAFLDALARSAWSADRYGGPSNNSLLRIYKSIGGTGQMIIDETTQFTKTTWGIADGKILTKDDVDTIINEMKKANLFGGSLPIVGDTAERITRQTLAQYIGKPWNDETRKQVQEALFSAADKAMPDTPLQTIADIGSHLLDPVWWTRVIALIAGSGLIVIGLLKLINTTTPLPRS
jgi:hypothetical protein